MKLYFKTVLLLFYFIVYSFIGNTQVLYNSAVNISGGSHSFGNYSFEWNVGESVDISTMQSSGLVFTNGLLQYNKAHLTTEPLDSLSFNTESWYSSDLKIYPNPFRDNLEINFLHKQAGKISMTIYDLSNHFISRITFDYYGMGSTQKWSLSQLASGQYALHIQQINPLTGRISKSGSFKLNKLN